MSARVLTTRSQRVLPACSTTGSPAIGPFVPAVAARKGSRGRADLLDELTVAADHREVDEFRAAVIGWREAHDEVAEIDVVHAFQRDDQLFPGQVSASTFQTLDHHFGDDEPFEAREVEVLLTGFAQDFLVFPYNEHAPTPRERYDLRDRYPVSLVLERVGKRFATDERDVVK